MDRDGVHEDASLEVIMLEEYEYTIRFKVANEKEANVVYKLIETFEKDFNRQLRAERKAKRLEKDEANHQNQLFREGYRGKVL